MELFLLPNEILVHIFQRCDFQTLGRLAVVSRHAKECVGSDSVWKYKWESLQQGNSYHVSVDPSIPVCYKMLCRRLSAVLKASRRTRSAGFQSRRLLRRSFLGDQSALYHGDDMEVLALDFGSKTTWLKRSCGQWICLEHTRTPLQWRKELTVPHAKPTGFQSSVATNSVADLHLTQRLSLHDEKICGHDTMIQQESCVAKVDANYSPVDGQILNCKHGLVEHLLPGRGDCHICDKHEKHESSHHATAKAENDITLETNTGKLCPELISAEEAYQTGSVDSATNHEVLPQGGQEGRGEATGSSDLGCEGLWLDEVDVPKGPLLCTCITCEPRRCVMGGDKLFSIPRPASCIHAQDAGMNSQGSTLEQSQGRVAHLGKSGSGAVGETKSFQDDEMPINEDLLCLIHRLVRMSGIDVDHRTTSLQVSEPTGWSRPQLVSIVRTAFEGLAVERMCLVPKSVCVAMAFGIPTCLVVDSGAHYTQVSVVVDQRLVEGTEQIRCIGGAHVSQCLAEVLAMKGIQPQLCACELDCQYVKERCYLSHRVGGRRSSSPVQLFIPSLRYPKRWCDVTLTEELGLAPEVMYLTLNLPKIIQKALEPFPFSVQKRLVANVIPTGGNTTLTGFASRLQLDLQTTLTDLAPWVWVRKRCRTLCQRSSNDAVEGVSYVSYNTDPMHDPISQSEGQQYFTKSDYIIHGAEKGLRQMQRFWRREIGSCV